MREFVKSMLSFSWAMSLFGIRQATNLINPRAWTGDPAAPGGLDAVTNTIVCQFGPALKETFDVGDRLQRQFVDASFGWPAVPAGRPGGGPGGGEAGWPADPAYATVREPSLTAALQQDPREEVLIRYIIGTGTVSPDGRHIVLKAGMYQLNGERDGYHHGVLQARFRDPAELTPLPPAPREPLDAPSEVVPLDVRGDTKARWIFGDGSTLTGVGPALAEVVSLRGGAQFLFVPVLTAFTGGTGRFEGARGIKTALGSTFLAPQARFAPGATIPIRSVETFKVIRAPDLQPDSRSPASASDLRGGPVQSRSVEVFGSKMHYVDAGDGPPVLFLHGNPTSSYLWRNVIPCLLPRARCLCPDLIGMGQSDKPDIEYRFADHARYLEEFIRKLRLEGIILVLHDWGGPLGFDYAMRQERNVKGISFMECLLRPYPTWDDFPARGSGPEFDQLRNLFRKFRLGGVGGEGWQLIVDQNVFVENVIPQVAGRPLTEEEMDHYREPFRAPASRKPIWRLANELPIARQPLDVHRRAAEFSRKLQHSRLPKLLFYGTPGAVLREPHVQWARDNLSNLEVIACGPGIHLLPETSPSLIGGELARWVQEIARGRQPHRPASRTA